VSERGVRHRPDLVGDQDLLGETEGKAWKALGKVVEPLASRRRARRIWSAIWW